MTGAPMSDQQTHPPGHRDWRLWAVLGVTAVLLTGGLIAWAVSEGVLFGDEDTPHLVDDYSGWTATGTLADDTDLIEDAAEKLDSERTPVLLWAGEGRNGVNEVTDFVAFAVSVDDPQLARGIVRVVLVNMGDSPTSPAISASSGSLDNVVIRLPLDEADGTEENNIYLTREDVRSLTTLDGDEVTVDDRLAGSSDSRFEIRSDDGIGYTSDRLAAPLYRDAWDAEIATVAMQDTPHKGGWITTLGEPTSVEFDEGTGVVVPLVEQRVRGLTPGTEDVDDLPENVEVTSRWAALVQVPDAMVESATSPTVRSPYVPTNQNVDALTVGYPYAVPVTDDRLGGSVLITTEGLAPLGGTGGAVPDPAYGTFNAELSSVRTEPDLPAIASAESGVTSVLLFDARTALVAWYAEDGSPAWSTIVRPAEDD